MVLTKKIFILTIIAGFLFGERLIIPRNEISHPQTPFPQSNLQLKFITKNGIKTQPIQRFQNFQIFKDFKLPSPKKGRKTLDILVLRVEFVEDDDPSTTGNGKMDLVGLGKPSDGLFYDPPHTKKYFSHQMEFLRNYYKANSFGNLQVNFTVKPERPLECYQLPHEMRYYSGFDHYDSNTGFVYYNTYAMEMGMVRILVDAIAAADLDETIDFSDYDNIIIFHAGTLLQSSLNFYRFCDIPSAEIPPGALEYYLGVPFILANEGADTIECGVDINSEMARVDSFMVGAIGTVVHEFGHILGLPDLYDVSGWSCGVGAWDLMSTGGWAGDYSIGAPDGSIPTNLSAWSRYSLGWVQPKIITSPESLLNIRASEIDTTQYSVRDSTMLKLPISETEYFLIENRQQDIRHPDTLIVDVEDGVPIYIVDGEYDFFSPGSGILIWHIDDNVINANYPYNMIQVNPQHKGVDLEEADGIQHFDAWWYGDSLEYYGSCYDPFFLDDSGKANSHFGPFTTPNSDSYFGKSFINIETKSTLDTVMNISVKFDCFQEGFPVMVKKGQQIYSVSYGDLDADGDIEVVVLTKKGEVYVYNHDGTLYGNATFNTATTFLSIGDVNGDSAADICFGGGFKLYCLDGKTLNLINNFPFNTGDEIVGAPLIFDIDNNGKSEICFGSKDSKIYCLNCEGANIENFPIYLNTWILSTPCVFNPGKREIGVLGSDGRFWILNKEGIIKEFTDSQHNMLGFASPVVGDIDRDGKPEAVVINGYGTIYIYGEDSLEEKFDILIDTTFYFTPALSDIDGDGWLELIMPNSSKTLFVCNRNGTSENNFPIDYNDFISYPLLIGDLDNNQTQEIAFGLGTSDSLGNGQLKLVNNRNQEFEYSPLFGWGGFSSPGVLFDIDLDGDLEIACGSDSGKLYIWDFPGDDVSWGGYMNSPSNSGYFMGELTKPSFSKKLLGSFYVYPSPVEKNGRVRFYLNVADEVNVQILDIAGRKIGGVSLTHPTLNEYNEVEFDFTNQANGIYIARVEAKSSGKREVKFKKFAVLK